MLKEVQPKDLVAHIVTGDIHAVMDVDEKYGWFKTQNLYTRKIRIYGMNVEGNSTFTKLTYEEAVDFYLRQARDRAESSRGVNGR